jgi:hypothetical protein
VGARAASTLSLLLLSAGLSGAQGFTALRDQIQDASPAKIVEAVAANDRALQDNDISSALNEAENASGLRRERLAERLRSMVELKAMGEQTSATPTTARESVIQEARQIKASVLYRDAGVDEESNWLGRSLSRLRNLRPNLRLPAGPTTSGFLAFGNVLIYLMWGLLGLGIAYLLYLALRHVRWRNTLARRARAVLEDDEPDRTLDEWLDQADALASEGKHREAVRALYLACLLRFDEHRVARFVRGETNWEHLARIRASDHLPSDVDFRPPTQAFDRIWYGKLTRGQADVDQFRVWYQEITSKLAKVTA